MSRINVEIVKDLLSSVKNGGFSKEAVPEVLVWMLKNDVWDVARASDALGVASVDISDVESICERVVRDKESFIRERGESALGPLMGMQPTHYICNCGPTSTPGNPLYDRAHVG